MAEKKLKVGSTHTNNSGSNDTDLVRARKIMRLNRARIMLENQDQREDAQRSMAWFALAGMLLYPVAVVLASWLGLEQGSQILGDMAATYFVSVAAIVAAFYGSQAYTVRGGSDVDVVDDLSEVTDDNTNTNTNNNC